MEQTCEEQKAILALLRSVAAAVTSAIRKKMHRDQRKIECEVREECLSHTNEFSESLLLLLADLDVRGHVEVSSAIERR